MQNDYQQSLAQEQSLTNALEQQRDAFAELAGIGTDPFARRGLNRQIFDSLMQRTKRASRRTRSSNIRVVDAAEVPRRRRINTRTTC
jgi:hypothetical protein